MLASVLFIVIASLIGKTVREFWENLQDVY